MGLLLTVYVAENLNKTAHRSPQLVVSSYSVPSRALVEISGGPALVSPNLLLQREAELSIVSLIRKVQTDTC